MKRILLIISVLASAITASGQNGTFKKVEVKDSILSFTNNTDLKLSGKGTGQVNITDNLDVDGTANVDGTFTVNEVTWDGIDRTSSDVLSFTGSGALGYKRVGVDLQAWDADLDTYSGITPSANVQTLLGSADYAGFRTSLGLGSLAIQSTITESQISDLSHFSPSTIFSDYSISDGTDGQVLTTDGAGNLAFETVSGGGGGDVTKIGTPVNNQVGVWTGDGTIEGDPDFQFDGTFARLGSTVSTSGIIFESSSSSVIQPTTSSYTGFTELRGDASSIAPKIQLYGNSHATFPGQIRFFGESSTSAMTISGTNLSFNGNLTTTGDITAGSVSITSGTSDDVLLGDGSTTSLAALGGISFGTDNQIPFTNSGGTNFDYSSALTFDGTAMSLTGTSASNAPLRIIYNTDVIGGNAPALILQDLDNTVGSKRGIISFRNDTNSEIGRIDVLDDDGGDTNGIRFLNDSNQNILTLNQNREALFEGALRILGSAAVPPTTPSSASDTGKTGTITWDSNFIYICVATNTWKRVAIATW